MCQIYDLFDEVGNELRKGKKPKNSDAKTMAGSIDCRNRKQRVALLYERQRIASGRMNLVFQTVRGRQLRKEIFNRSGAEPPRPSDARDPDESIVTAARSAPATSYALTPSDLVEGGAGVIVQVSVPVRASNLEDVTIALVEATENLSGRFTEGEN